MFNTRKYQLKGCESPQIPTNNYDSLSSEMYFCLVDAIDRIWRPARSDCRMRLHLFSGRLPLSSQITRDDYAVAILHAVCIAITKQTQILSHLRAENGWLMEFNERVLLKILKNICSKNTIY